MPSGLADPRCGSRRATAKSFSYDGVGNRTQEVTVPLSGASTTDTLSYLTDKNRVVSVVRGTTTLRTLVYDNAGNLTSDSGAAGSKPTSTTSAVG